MIDTTTTTPTRQATPNTWSDGIVAILSQSGRAVGTGFVISKEGLIVTCAHVLADNVGVGPGGKVSLRFKANGQIAEATVTAWWRDKTSEDVAVLSLLVELPYDVTVLPLAAPDESLAQVLHTFGYPKVGLFDGLWGEGVALQLVNENGFSRLQLRSQEITHGFSGAPLYDKTRNCVVGMVQQGVRPEHSGRLRDTAFATPVETIVAVCSQIPLVKFPRPALDAVAQPLPPCPYRGLFAFREEDKDLFFGRETLTQQLANAVLRQRWVAVLGPSGSGKSSLVFAGMLPQLRPGPDWLIADFRPGSEPFKALAAALLPWLEPALSETDRLVEINKLTRALVEGDLPLADVLQRIGQKQGRASHCLLVADQFEELFTLCQDIKRRQAFLDMLLVTLHEPVPPALILVATLRADFMGQALAYRPLADALQDHTFMMGPMNEAELQTAIEQPALRCGVRFEPGLVARILEDVGDDPGNLPLLEFALTRLWDESQTSPLTHQAYKAIGQVQGALANHADQVYERLAPGQKEQSRRVMVQLVQPGTGTEDTRRQATRDELGEADWQLAQQLAGPETRLLVTNQDESGQETVEVIHEALIQRWKPLQTWMEQDREFRSWQERLRALCAQWQTSGRDDSALLRGYLLGEAESWLVERKGQLAPEEFNLIQVSLRYRLQEQQAEEERRQREIEVANNLAEAQQRQITFVRAMSHDLRGPLSYMRGYAALLSIVSETNERQQEIISKIMAGIDQMSSLIESILNLGRLESGLELMLETAQPEQVLENVNLMHKQETEQAGIRVVIDVPRDLPLFEADLSLLQQALTNLVDNAVKYAKDGGLLTLSAFVQGEELIFSVRDKGPGIPPDIIPRLFDEFYRYQQHGAQHVRGVGLGLTLVRSIAKLHGGRAWCQSQLGEGSTFYVSVPLSSQPDGL